jgi:hypothetical protein
MTRSLYVLNLNKRDRVTLTDTNIADITSAAENADRNGWLSHKIPKTVKNELDREGRLSISILTDLGSSQSLEYPSTPLKRER